MVTLKYTVCSYVDGGARSLGPIDFGVLVVSEREAIIVGFNLADRGIKSDDPMTGYVIENTIDILHQRLRDCMNDPASKTGYDLLDRIVDQNFSSIFFRSVQETRATDGTPNAAFQIFFEQVLQDRDLIRAAYPARPEIGAKPVWEDSPPSGLRVHRSQLVQNDRQLFEHAAFA